MRKAKSKINSRLNVGCGDLPFEGWVNLDLRPLKGVSVRSNAAQLPFKDGVFEIVYASHVIEHFDFLEGFEVLKEWKRVLKTGGNLIIECPDFLGLCRRFVQCDEGGRIGLYMHIFGNPWIKEQIHKFLYTPNQLRWTLEQLGFKNIVQTEQKRFPGGNDINLRMECTK